MLDRRARVTVAVCVVALGLLGSGCGAADTRDVVGAETVGSASATVDPAAAFLQYDLGISSEEAVRLLEVQETAPRLNALLAAQAPETFGGL